MAGLQDRVVQAYESPVFMDFNKELMERQGFGDYNRWTVNYSGIFILHIAPTLLKDRK